MVGGGWVKQVLLKRLQINLQRAEHPDEDVPSFACRSSQQRQCVIDTVAP
jgi:hypothetical protein